jgi:protein phosphatase 1 regulatory subunit 37
LVSKTFIKDYPFFLFQTGITYIAQVLKRNRTLKVLNLSENKLDVQCLVIIAEALVCFMIICYDQSSHLVFQKYNSSLETLDLNKNPCSGPGLEGVRPFFLSSQLNLTAKQP